MTKRLPPKLSKLPLPKQRAMDSLLEKNSDGTITPIEKARLEKLVEEAEKLMVVNAKRLADFSIKRQAPGASGAVPVTVWVQPARAGR